MMTGIIMMRLSPLGRGRLASAASKSGEAGSDASLPLPGSQQTLLTDLSPTG